jgi:hypothetical protein
VVSLYLTLIYIATLNARDDVPSGACARAFLRFILTHDTMRQVCLARAELQMQRRQHDLRQA